MLEEKDINPLTDFELKKSFAKFSPKERDAYESSLKYFRDMQNVVDTAREEGEEDGHAKGKEEGRNEMKIEMAKEMKKQGLSFEQIAKVTGLSVTEIENL